MPASRTLKDISTNYLQMLYRMRKTKTVGIYRNILTDKDVKIRFLNLHFEKQLILHESHWTRRVMHGKITCTNTGKTLKMPNIPNASLSTCHLEFGNVVMLNCVTSHCHVLVTHGTKFCSRDFIYFKYFANVYLF